MATINISFTLNDERDRRIVRYLEELPKGEKSKAIRQALAAHLGSGGLTLGDVYQAVQDLDRKVGAGVVLMQPAGSAVQPPVSEPGDIAASLDSLGLD